MSALNLISVNRPGFEVCRNAFSTTFRIYSNSELQSVDPTLRHCTQNTMGAIYRSDGSLVAFSERGGGRNTDLVAGLDAPDIHEYEIVRPSQVMKGRTLYLGYFMNHYGHFLLETLSRLWSIGAFQYDNYVMFPFTFNGGNVLPTAFHRRFLSFFGLSLENVTILRNPVEFEEIHVPDRTVTINRNANLHALEIYRSVSSRYCSVSAPPRIFLSRLQPYARAKNIPQVEKLFSEFGFKVIYPEIMNIDEQLYYYSNCCVLAGFAGSGLHNCVFCREGAYVIELGDVRSRAISLTSQRVANELARVNAAFIPYRGSDDGWFDVEGVRNALASIRLLGFPYSKLGSGIVAADADSHYTWPGVMTLHVANRGDISQRGSFEAGMNAGARSSVEGFSISLDADAPVRVEYKVLQNDSTWSQWSTEGTFVGSRGEARPIRGFSIRVLSDGPFKFACRCVGRFSDMEDLVVCADGEECKAGAKSSLLGLEVKLILDKIERP